MQEIRQSKRRVLWGCLAGAAMLGFLMMLTACSGPDKRSDRKAYRPGSDSTEDSDSTASKPSKSPRNRPAWVTNPNKFMESDGQIFVRGWGENPGSVKDAAQMAQNDAFGEIAQRCGVTVQSVVMTSSEDNNGNQVFSVQDKTRIFSRPVVIRDYSVANNYQEEDAEKGYSYWTLLRVSPKEMRRMCRNVSGTASWRVNCGEGQSCPMNFVDQVGALASEMKLKLKGSPLGPEMKYTSPEEIGEQFDSAYLLDVALTMESYSVEDDVHYVWVSLTWSIKSTDDGQILQTVNVPKIKHGEFSKEKAFQSAAEKQLKTLRTLFPKGS